MENLIAVPQESIVLTRPYFKFGDHVVTPNGPGIYQGIRVSMKRGVPTQIIVSHRAEDCPSLNFKHTGKNGKEVDLLWDFFIYTDPNEVKAGK